MVRRLAIIYLLLGLIGSLSGDHLWMYDTRRKSVRAEAALQGKAESPPVICEDQTVVVATQDYVTRFRIPPPSK